MHIGTSAAILSHSNFLPKRAMGKKKLIRFAENRNFACLHQLSALQLREQPHPFSGSWSGKAFNNDQDLILELGCGRGEYALGLGALFPEKNFIGCDIKGSRLYFGAKEVLEKQIGNVAFVRTAIDLIDRIFYQEISEIWITFPDPFIEKPRRRLTSPFFLNRYLKVLKPGGLISLKTDNEEFFNFTLWLARENNLKIVKVCRNVHAQSSLSAEEAIQTRYEQKFRAQGKPIYLLKFILDHEIEALQTKES